jgi:hypothetical protein
MTGLPNPRRFQFRLRSLFVLTTVVAVLAWLASFETVRLFLAILFSLAGMCFGFFGILYVILYIATFIFGTPGERQRRDRLKSNAAAIESAAEADSWHDESENAE